MVDVDVHILSHLKEELAWAADKQLRVISTLITLFIVATKELKGTKYGTAQFELYTCMQVHACACMFNVCKT